jgi:hypothetical protein
MENEVACHSHGHTRGQRFPSHDGSARWDVPVTSISLPALVSGRSVSGTSGYTYGINFQLHIVVDLMTLNESPSRDLDMLVRIRKTQLAERLR